MRFLAILALFILAAMPALAQVAGEPVPTTPLIDLMRPYIEAIVAAVVMALLGWAAAMIQKWTGIKVEAAHREAIQTAAMTGASKVLAHIAGRSDLIKITAEGPLVAEGVKWVQKSVPDAVAYFDAKPAMLEQIVLGKFGQLQVAAQSGTQAPPDADVAKPAKTTAATKGD